MTSSHESARWTCPHCFIVIPWSRVDDVHAHTCEGVRAAVWSAMSRNPTAKLDATIKTLTNPRSKRGQKS